MARALCVVYILTNKGNTVLYTGVTSDLENRLYDHLNKTRPNSFTARYNLQKLVYVEPFNSISDAIVREKQIKAGSRKNKLKLIEKDNPDWTDLSSSLFGFD
ncbi:MAG: GIY-YIG nuclease family protein [Candidatus Marinimicrobia bacterium]|jgi:putative endonuclease|nr:GIY-YIG nuclease family protein [Candidatus Neomarinimicrobiota bacterium]MBT3576004.1 GIY-YIG nuclease family protein [Candidatus Neomarinimicrobiota bacterium]MBT3680510.1 GIY-YIG nuclease family protein [Candidatus Neomarinimicrobiota bacterium]MBT3949451.1 GIY-YIG nuclease family protein [Candidatus Neomarinimicrobiota bacterium]MBT4253859.1 GIY-YIG nuclease family protein [Candidatus Neomarinimicrobiota bacterium]